MYTLTYSPKNIHTDTRTHTPIHSTDIYPHTQTDPHIHTITDTYTPIYIDIHTHGRTHTEKDT